MAKITVDVSLDFASLSWDELSKLMTRVAHRGEDLLGKVPDNEHSLAWLAVNATYLTRDLMSNVADVVNKAKAAKAAKAVQLPVQPLPKCFKK